MRHGHYVDGSEYLFKLIKRGENNAIFNHCEDFIELALQVCEKGTKLDAKTFVYDFGRIIGLDKFGISTSKVEVYLGGNFNTIRTAYPVPM